MSIRHPAAAFLLGSMLAAPLCAQPQIDYGDNGYEYAQAAPVVMAQEQTEFTYQPVVQPVAEAQEAIETVEPDVAAVRTIPPRATVPVVQQPYAAPPAAYAYAQPVYVQPAYAAPQVAYSYPAPYAVAAMPAQQYAPVVYASPQPVTYAYPGGYVAASRSIPAVQAQPHYAPAPAYLPAGAQIVSFDRNAWLAECRDRLDDYDEDDRGEVIGALVGAVAGGIAGNRIADGERLGGTLLGAGLGGLAGMAVGGALDDDGDDTDSARQCQAYLDDYMARAQRGELAQAPAAGGQYMLVPTVVQVPRQATYGEAVVEGN